MTATPGQPLDFWFDFASTYSYLSAMRIEDAARGRGVPLRWRPFLLGPIFAAQGWNTSPFNLFPAKGRYMWRDMERLARERGLALEQPDPFPQNSLLAARVALAVRSAAPALLADFCKGVFKAQFGHGATISENRVLGAILDDLGLDAAAVLEAAASAPIKGELRAETGQAQGIGVFGAPTFVTGFGELFWGDDRLDQALEWAGRPARAR